MHRHLSNQLRRTVGLSTPDEIDGALTELASVAATMELSPGAKKMLLGLDKLLQRVGLSYEQYERDLELRARSLELSSDELAMANEHLQKKTTVQSHAIEELRLSANEMLRGDGKAEIGAEASDLRELVQTLSVLVRDRAAVQHELEMQKFAMDQHAIVSITDRDGSIIYANELFCKISGYALPDLFGKNHRIINSNFHPPAFFQKLWQTVLAGQVWRGEIRNRNRAGKLYWVAATIVPLLNAVGEVERFIAIRTDITNRKLVEAAMEESRSFLQGITDTLGEGVFRLDDQMQCEFLNPEAEHQLGFSLLELIDQPFFDRVGLCDDELRPIDYKNLIAHVSADAPFRSEELFLRRRNGEIFPVSLAIVPLGEKGTADGWVGSFRDIHERKRAQEELAAAKSEADRANHMKGQFLANMSHELRTPLNAVIGLGHIVQQSNLQPQQRDYLQKMESASQHLLGLINDILDYSKIESGKLTIESIPLSPAEVVREVVNLLQPKAQNKNLLLIFNIAENVPEILLSDRKRLSQVLLNLADNALKFTEQGEVHVGISGQLDDAGLFKLRVDIRDHGIGLTPEQITKLFKPFVQADGSTARRFGGTGLGLAICRELVELMGGHIGVTSEVDVGSTFYFELPCPVGKSRFDDVEQKEAAAQSALLEPPASLLGYSVLVVEDDFFNQEMLRALLESWGMAVAIAGTGAEALAHLREKSFDIMLQDLQLPDIDGDVIVQRLRNELELTDLPVIALTGSTEPEQRAYCLDVGFNDFVTKPYDFDVLLKAMRRLLGIAEVAATATAGTQINIVVQIPPAEFQRWLDRIEPLLIAFDPDALELSVEFECVCKDSAAAILSKRFRRDLESYDFVAAKKSFEELKKFCASDSAAGYQVADDQGAVHQAAVYPAAVHQAGTAERDALYE